MAHSKNRRSFIKKSAVAGIAIPLFTSSLLACNSKENSKKLKILILGGTSFLGPHQIAYALKGIARSLRIPVFAVHQLNRGVENRNNKRPNMADLRESGKIEEAADKIMMVYRPWMYDKELYSPHECEIIAAKHRDGEPIDTKLYFNGAIATFSDVIEQKIETYER